MSTKVATKQTIIVGSVHAHTMLEYACCIELLPESHTLCSVGDVLLLAPPVEHSLRVEDTVEIRSTDTNTLVPECVCECV